MSSATTRRPAASSPSTRPPGRPNVDLLVVGHRGRGGFAGLSLGSTAMRAVSHASCPTMVVRGAAHQPRDRGIVLAAIDITDPAPEVFAYACDEAERRGARLKVISSWEIGWPRPATGGTGRLRQASQRALDAAEHALRRLIRPWRTEYPDLQIDHELADGPPGAVLTAATGAADLIVVGAHWRGRHGGRPEGAWLGPVAHTLLSHADCPVVIVPHD